MGSPGGSAYGIIRSVKQLMRRLLCIAFPSMVCFLPPEQHGAGHHGDNAGVFSGGETSHRSGRILPGSNGGVPVKVLLVSTNTLTEPYAPYPIGLDYVRSAISPPHQVKIVDMNELESAGSTGRCDSRISARGHRSVKSGISIISMRQM